MLFYSAQIKVETQGELMLNVHLSFPGLAERGRRDFATQFGMQMGKGDRTRNER